MCPAGSTPPERDRVNTADRAELGSQLAKAIIVEHNSDHTRANQGGKPSLLQADATSLANAPIGDIPASVNRPSPIDDRRGNPSAVM